MAHPSFSIEDETLEQFDRILDVKEMMDELDTDARSPVVQELLEQYIKENEEYLRRYEEFVEGNPTMAAMAAD